MSPFIAEILKEVSIRILTYKRQIEELKKAQERIEELELLLAEAETHKCKLEEEHGKADPE